MPIRNSNVGATVKTLFAALALVASFGSFTGGHAATVYIWRDDNGVRQYSDACPPGERCRTKQIGSSGEKKGKGRWKQTSDGGDSSTSSGSTDTGTTGTSGGDTTGSTTGSPDTASTTDTSTADPTPEGDTTASSDTASGDTTTGDSTGGATSYGNLAVLEWDPVIHSELSGYRVYYAPSGQPTGGGIDVGDVTTYTLSGLGSGTTYYFMVTAVDTSGNESAFSNQAFKSMP